MTKIQQQNKANKSEHDMQRKNGKVYVPHKWRSRPMRCTSLPLFALFFFILYWFILCPLIYVNLNHANEAEKGRKWPALWQYQYWIACLVIFLLVLICLVFFWRCNPKKNKQCKNKEKENLLKLKKQNSLYKIEAKQLSEEDLIDSSNQQTKKTTKEKEKPVVIEMLTKKTPAPIKEDAFKKEQTKAKQRPKSLFIKPQKDQSQEMKNERPRSMSPLTPREIFFFDLIQEAHKKQCLATGEFLDKERRNYDDGKYVSSVKTRPENLDNLQEQCANECSLNSPVYSANVPIVFTPVATSEVFIYVDNEGGEEQQKQTREFKIIPVEK